ncbi:alpha/beta hydrolase [Anaerolineales bacterium HSG6]|nr:alpha/beta hydrolase [Anaerolineales bacterium HSG6]
MTESMILYEVNNQPIYVHEEGRKREQVMILIHGWSSSWYSLSPLLPNMRKRFRCMAVDLPGYGQTPRPPERITMELYADLLADLIRQVSKDREVVLTGHSMGGMIALIMALRHPDLVERLILLAPTITGNLSLFINMWSYPITMLERFFVVDWIVSLFESQLAWATDRIMRPASLAAKSGMSEEDYQRLRGDARHGGQGKTRAECYWGMREGDLRGKLNKIKKPTLVIWGLEDNTVPLRDASVMADEMPKADMRFMPNVSHWPQFEAREQTLRYIDGFLGRPMNLFKVLSSTGAWQE